MKIFTVVLYSMSRDLDANEAADHLRSFATQADAEEYARWVEKTMAQRIEYGQVEVVETELREETPEEKVERLQFPKKCACGKEYLDEDDWMVETRPAYVREDEYSVNEGRHCECGSTLEVVAICFDAELE